MMTALPSGSILQAVIQDDLDGFQQALDKHAETQAWAHSGDLAVHKALRCTTQSLINALGEDGETALHEAVRYNRPAWVARLLDHGADINAPVGFRDHGRSRQLGPLGGNRPLHLALLCENAGMLQTLIERGADATLPDREGRSLLDLIKQASKDPDLTWEEKRRRAELGQQALGWLEARELRVTIDAVAVVCDTGSRPRL